MDVTLPEVSQLRVEAKWLWRRVESDSVCTLRVQCSGNKGELIQVVYTMRRAVFTWDRGRPCLFQADINTQVEHPGHVKRTPTLMVRRGGHRTLVCDAFCTFAPTLQKH